LTKTHFWCIIKTMSNNELLNHAPELAMIAGAIGGLAVDYYAAKYSVNQREGALSTQGVSEDEFAARHQNSAQVTAVEETTPPKYRGNLLRGAAVPVSMAIAAGLAADAWIPEQTTQTKGAVLELVGDHSFSAGQNGAADKVNTIFDEFRDTGSLKVRALVAHNGSYDPIKIERVTDDQPYGPASMKEATAVAMTDAYNAAPAVENGVIGQAEKRNTGVLVVTDNNAIGNVETVVKQAEANGGMPIFIANVGKAKGQTAKNLKQIAERTSGKYWDANTKPEAVAKAIESAVTPQEVAEPGSADNKVSEKILSLLSILLAGGVIKWRADAKFLGRRRNKVTQ
jgi:hypothetical protein